MSTGLSGALTLDHAEPVEVELVARRGPETTVLFDRRSRARAVKRPIVPFLTPPDTAVSHGEWLLQSIGRGRAAAQGGAALGLPDRP